MSEEIKKISISGMLKKRNGNNLSPPKKEEIQNNTEAIPKIKLSLGKKNENKLEDNINNSNNEKGPIKISLNKNKIEKNSQENNKTGIHLKIGQKNENENNNKKIKEFPVNINKNNDTNSKEISINTNKNEEENKNLNNIKISTNKTYKTLNNKNNINNKDINIDPQKIVNIVDKENINKDTTKKPIEFGEYKLVKEDEVSIFENYQSDFETESNVVIDKIKKYKKGNKKSKIFILYSIIGILSIVIIGFLFINLNLLNTTSTKADLIRNTQKTTKNITIKDKTKQEKAKSEKWKKEEIKKFGKKIIYEYKQDDNGKKIFKYKDKVYKSLSELNKKIDSEYSKNKILLENKNKLKNSQKNLISENQQKRLQKIKDFLIKNKK